MFTKSPQVLILLIWVTAFSPCAVLSNRISTKKTLYRPGDEALVLKGTTITKTVFDSTNAWLVQFYTDWCPTSQDFVPSYRNLARETFDWRNLVEVAAINCADGSNTYVCDKFGVHSYPAVRFFPAGSARKAYSNGTFVNQGQEFSPHISSRMKTQLIDLLEPQYPNLLSFTNHSGDGIGALSELWGSNESVSRPTTIVLIFEPRTSNWGQEIALRLSLHRTIKVFRFSNVNNIYDMYAASIVSKTKSPAVLFLGPDKIPKRLAVKTSDPVDLVCKSVLRLSGIEGTPPSTWALATMERPEEPILSSGKVTGMGADGAYTMRFNMTYYMRLEALKGYMTLLVHYFPANDRKIQDFFNALYPWILSKETLLATELKEKLDDLEYHFNPWSAKDWMWRDCENIDTGHRGYTCGLWRLFHAMTFVVVKATEIQGATEAISGYAENFLACQECYQQFRTVVNSTVNRNHVSILGSNTTAAGRTRSAHSHVYITATGNLTVGAGFPHGNYTID